MSRLLLLTFFILWLCPRGGEPAVFSMQAGVGIFLGGYIFLIAALCLWSRRLARRLDDLDLYVSLNRYNKVMEIARYFIPAWFACGLFGGLHWGLFVDQLLGPLNPHAYNAGYAHHVAEPYWRIPGLLVGTLPPMLAWIGLWWAQYPADRALREQSLLVRMNEGLPVHEPPRFWRYLKEHFRQQIVFTLAPIFLMMVVRDLLAAAWLLYAGKLLPRSAEDFLILPFALLIFIAAPELLRRVIPTRPLPAEWPLRQRLENLCRRVGVRCRDVLLWETSSSVGNAMVMGLFPRVRYIFLSDLLLETMTEEEIEAVFAHELGHIVHHHMWWYVGFALTLMLAAAGPFATILDYIPPLAANGVLQAQIATAISLGVFIVSFGFLSRRFERQADVFAARTMQVTYQPTVRIAHYNPMDPGAPMLLPTFVGGPATLPIPTRDRSFVGQYGASIVASALHRVARVNNIPVAAREWLHGSIGGRMEYLHKLAADPALTARFDRFMVRLYACVLLALVTCGAWTAMGWFVA